MSVTVYQDGTEEHSPTASTSTYLSFLVLEDGELFFIQRFLPSQHPRTLQYSINDGNWISATSTTAYTAIVNVSAGDVIRFKGNEQNYERNSLECTARHIIYGNIMSLLYGDNFSGNTQLSSVGTFSYIFSQTKVIAADNLILPSTSLVASCYAGMFKGCNLLRRTPTLSATTLANSCYGDLYGGMFEGCSSLTQVPELPATTLAEMCYYRMFKGCSSLMTLPTLQATALTQSCYAQMFYDCSSLVTVPSNYLPATSLALGCYEHTFRGCTGLTSAPYLPATTLADNCYEGMFEDCHSLASAPILPALTLATRSYERMFDACYNLKYVKCLATSIYVSSEICTDDWLNGVSNSGIFVKNPNMTNWPTGVDGIPSGWTVQDNT